MLQIGDEVVTMSAPGIFRVIAIDGPTVTIESGEGVRKHVLEGSVRTIAKEPVAH
jgi:preprotein translocase subunit YajC